MILGMQSQIAVGSNDQLPLLPEDYGTAYLSKGMVGAMGYIGKEKDFIPYFQDINDPTSEIID